MLDHPRSAIVGLSLVLKFGLDPIYSFGDITIFVFCHFDLLLIHTHFCFWGVGAYFPKIWSPIVLTLKRTIPAQKKHRLSHKAENRSCGSTWAQERQTR